MYVLNLGVRGLISLIFELRRAKNTAPKNEWPHFSTQTNIIATSVPVGEPIAGHTRQPLVYLSRTLWYTCELVYIHRYEEDSPWTVTSALEEARPRRLDATHVYSPSSANTALLITRVELLSDSVTRGGTVWFALVHRICAAGSALTLHVRRSCFPARMMESASGGQIRGAARMEKIKKIQVLQKTSNGWYLCSRKYSRGSCPSQWG